jgi:hypothetical protein
MPSHSRIQLPSGASGEDQGMPPGRQEEIKLSDVRWDLIFPWLEDGGFASIALIIADDPPPKRDRSRHVTARENPGTHPPGGSRHARGFDGSGCQPKREPGLSGRSGVG